MASIFLGEKLIPAVTSSIIISFIGIIMIVRPPFLLVFLGLEVSDSTLNNPYLVMGLIASILFSFLESLSAILIRSLSNTVKVTGII